MKTMSMTYAGDGFSFNSHLSSTIGTGDNQLLPGRSGSQFSDRFRTGIGPVSQGRMSRAFKSFDMVLVEPRLLEQSNRKVNPRHTGKSPA
jgi:hypothetical protein